MRLSFRVYGVALPKGNIETRIVRLKTGKQIPIATERNRSVPGWQQLVRQGASLARQEVGSNAMLEYGVRLTVAFYLPRPLKYNKRGMFVAHCTTPDTDKLLRAILDALTGVAYHDDKQVTEIVAGKYYADVAGASFVDVTVEPAPVREFAAPVSQAVEMLPLFAPLPEAP